MIDQTPQGAPRRPQRQGAVVPAKRRVQFALSQELIPDISGQDRIKRLQGPHGLQIFDGVPKASFTRKEVGATAEEIRVIWINGQQLFEDAVRLLKASPARQQLGHAALPDLVAGAPLEQLARVQQRLGQVAALFIDVGPKAVDGRPSRTRFGELLHPAAGLVHPAVFGGDLGGAQPREVERRSRFDGPFKARHRLGDPPAAQLEFRQFQEARRKHPRGRFHSRGKRLPCPVHPLVWIQMRRGLDDAAAKILEMRGMRRQLRGAGDPVQGVIVQADVAGQKRQGRVDQGFLPRRQSVGQRTGGDGVG